MSSEYDNMLFIWWQELPEVYADEGFAGNRDMYIISATGVRYKVRVVTKRNDTLVVTGPRWTVFCLENHNEDVELMHFVEEGDDCYYVRRQRIWWLQHNCRQIFKVYVSCTSLLRCAPGNSYFKHCNVCYLNMSFTYSKVLHRDK